MRGLPGLKGLNKQTPEDLILSELKSLSNTLINRLKNYTQGLKPTLIQSGTTSFGESRYDPTLATIEQFENVNEERAVSQPWYNKVLAGTAKGAVLAATTFADTFAGTIAGLITAGTEGRISGIWDNPVTQGFNKINEAMESILPNYYSELELKNRENGEWYKNIFTANFLGDTLLKNTGFMVGAALSGKVVAGAAAKMMLLNEARKAYEGYSIIANDGRKLESLAEKVKAAATGDAIIDGLAITQEAIQAAKALKTAPLKLKVIGATSGALGEARLEAVSNSKEFADRLTNQLNESIPLLEEEELNKLSQEAPDLFEVDGSLTQQGQDVLNNRMEKRYEDGLAKIEELRTKYGNRDFITNFALLAGSDYALFGRMYAGGFKNAVREKNIIGKIAEDGTRSVEAVKPSLLKKAWSAAKMPITEGPIEEMGQATIAKTLNQYYGAEFNSFMGHLIDPNANKEAIDWFNAIGQGVKETYGTAAGWEEGFVGALMGGIGIPGRSTTVDSNGKKKHGIILNGAFGEVKELNQNYKEDKQLADELNIRFQDPKFLEQYKALIRRNSFEADKQSALDAKDEFEFKNAEHSALISDAILFDKIGRIQDLYDHVESMGNLSDEDLAEIKNNLTSKEKKLPAYANKTDEELKQYFKDKATGIKESIDNYRQIADALSVKVGDTFKGDDLVELTWMLTKVDNWEKRFRDVHEDLKKGLKPIVKQLNGGVYKDADEVESPIDEVLQQSPGDLLAALLDETSKLANQIDSKRESHRKATEKSRNKATDQLILILAKEGNRGLPLALAKLDRLKKELKKNGKLLKDSDKMIKQIEDLTRLSSARVAFLNRYNGYITNPERLKLDLKKVVVEAKKEETKINNDLIKELKDIVDTFTTYEQYKEFLNKKTAEDNTFDAEDFNNKMHLAGNPFATQHKLFSKTVANTKQKVDSTIASSAVKEGAQQVVDGLLKISSTKEDFLDPSKIISLGELGPIVLKNGEMLTPELMEEVDKLVLKVMSSTREEDKELLNRDDLNQFNVKLEDGEVVVNKVNQETDIPGKDLTPVNELTNTSSTSTNGTRPLAPADNPKPVTPVNSNGQEAYYFNPVPEFEVNAKKKGIFIPYKDLFPHEKEIYDFFTRKGTWNYLNSLNVKEGDKVGFMIDQSFRNRHNRFADTIFITHGPNNQIIGSLHAGKKAEKFVGLVELRERIEKEFAETGKITETTTVGLVNSGYIEQSRGKDTDLNDPSKHVDRGNLVFAIATHGLDFFFNHPTISPNKLVAPNKSGMVYLYQEAGDGNYMPVPCTIKPFTKEEFDRNDLTTLKNTRFKKIDRAIDLLAKATEKEDVTEAYKILAKELYLGKSITTDKKVIHISLSKDKKTIIIRRVESDEAGNEVETSVDKIFLTEYDATPGVDAVLTGKEVKIKKTVKRDIAAIKSDIYDAIYKNEIIFNIDRDLINSPEYNEEIYDSNLLKTAMVESGVKTVWFYLLAKTPQGTPIDFVAPKVDGDALETVVRTNVKPTNAVTKQEHSIRGTRISYKNEKFFVDGDLVLNEKGEAIKGIKIPIIKALAYVQDGLDGKFGPTFIKDHKIGENEYTLADGRIVDIKNQEFKGIGNARKEVKPVENAIKSNEDNSQTLESKQPSLSPSSLDGLLLDPNLMGSFGEISTNFKESQTNAPKNLDMSKKSVNFAELEEPIRKALIAKKWTARKWEGLTPAEQQHEIECVK